MSNKEEKKKAASAQSSDEPKEINEELSTEELKKEIEQLKAQKDEYLAGWQRERADLINHKKEEIERMGQFIGFAKEELVLEILPILDNFEVAEKNLPDKLREDVNVKGLLQVKLQFEDFLKKLGVKEIKVVGEKFDPRFHEIVEEKPFDAAQGQKSGVIFEEVQKGYMMGGRLLRPAKVKVTK